MVSLLHGASIVCPTIPTQFSSLMVSDVEQTRSTGSLASRLILCRTRTSEEGCLVRGYQRQPIYSDLYGFSCSSDVVRERERESRGDSHLLSMAQSEKQPVQETSIEQNAVFRRSQQDAAATTPYCIYGIKTKWFLVGISAVAGFFR